MGIIQTLGMWKERIIRMFKGNIKNEFGVNYFKCNGRCNNRLDGCISGKSILG